MSFLFFHVFRLPIYCSVNVFSCSLRETHGRRLWSCLWESPLQFVFSNYPTHHLPPNIWQGVGNILAKPWDWSGETFSHSRKRLFLGWSSPWGSLWGFSSVGRVWLESNEQPTRDHTHTQTHVPVVFISHSVWNN